MLIDVWEPAYGGGMIHVWELSRKLVEKCGCRVDIYTRKLSDEKGAVYDKDESHLDGRLNVYRIGIPTRYSSVIGRLAYILLLPFSLKGRYDVIHSHAYYSAYPSKILRFLKRRPLVFTVHGIALKARDEMDQGLLSRIKSYMEDATLFRLRYDCEISVDSSIREYKNVNSCVEIIPNGVDAERFDSVEASPPEGFKILFVGRFHPQKGLSYLVDAAETVVSSHPNVLFSLVGCGPLEEEIKSKVEEKNLSKNFIFKGRLSGDELIREYKSSRLFVLPSLYEGQPLTLLEAWAARLPVVATDVGGNRDFIADGVNGYIIPPRDTVRLAEAINKAIENPRLEEMGLSGYETVKERYSWDAAAEKTMAIYDRLLKG